MDPAKYKMISDIAAELLGYLDARADGEMHVAIGLLIAAHGADMSRSPEMRLRMARDGAIAGMFLQAPTVAPTYGLRDALNAGRIVERCCPQCLCVAQSSLSAAEIMFMDTHATSEWPRITCRFCGFEGIGTRAETRLGSSRVTHAEPAPEVDE